MSTQIYMTPNTSANYVRCHLGPQLLRDDHEMGVICSRRHACTSSAPGLPPLTGRSATTAATPAASASAAVPALGALTALTTLGTRLLHTHGVLRQAASSSAQVARPPVVDHCAAYKAAFRS